MSNSLAIAATTASVRNLLLRLIPMRDAELADLEVTTQPPDIARKGITKSQANLFLYQTVVNGAWRNMDMPRQVRPGETGAPPLALNLHYLITTFGRGEADNDVISHRVLGGAMSVLHDHMLLSPDDIRMAVADNDLALGRVVEAVSHSRFWPTTAIFVLEDDAQNGPDHVDAHRSPAFVISPYTRRGTTDSTMYSTSSMLRTIELILGLQAMTQFDSAAMPMFNAFTSKSDLRPYTTRPVNVDLTERNSRTAWGGDRAVKMDFSKEDAVDDLLLNQMIWHSVRGASHPMPPPTRAAFVFAHPKGDDDD